MNGKYLSVCGCIVCGCVVYHGSGLAPYSPLAQFVERETVNLEAVGSTPTWRDTLCFLPTPHLLSKML